MRTRDPDFIAIAGDLVRSGGEQRGQQDSHFTFVMFHATPYTAGVHGVPPGDGPGLDVWSALPLQVLTPLFLRFGVDAVFSGHDEMYEHSNELVHQHSSHRQRDRYFLHAFGIITELAVKLLHRIDS